MVLSDTNRNRSGRKTSIELYIKLQPIHKKLQEYGTGLLSSDINIAFSKPSANLKNAKSIIDITYNLTLYYGSRFFCRYIVC